MNIRFGLSGLLLVIATMVIVLLPHKVSSASIGHNSSLANKSSKAAINGSASGQVLGGLYCTTDADCIVWDGKCDKFRNTCSDNRRPTCHSDEDCAFQSDHIMVCDEFTNECKDYDPQHDIPGPDFNSSESGFPVWAIIIIILAVLSFLSPLIICALCFLVPVCCVAGAAASSQNRGGFSQPSSSTAYPRQGPPPTGQAPPGYGANQAYPQAPYPTGGYSAGYNPGMAPPQSAPG